MQQSERPTELVLPSLAGRSDESLQGKGETEVGGGTARSSCLLHYSKNGRRHRTPIVHRNACNNEKYILSLGILTSQSHYQNYHSIRLAHGSTRQRQLDAYICQIDAYICQLDAQICYVVA